MAIEDRLIGIIKEHHEDGDRPLSPVEILDFDEGLDGYIKDLRRNVADLEASGAMPDRVLELKEQAGALIEALEGLRDGQQVRIKN